MEKYSVLMDTGRSVLMSDTHTHVHHSVNMEKYSVVMDTGRSMLMSDTHTYITVSTWRSTVC